jgi:DNA-binding transcriptional ArsR family regulator
VTPAAAIQARPKIWPAEPPHPLLLEQELLGLLRSPATTTALARQLGVTPSAVSQHLAALHRGGLIDRPARRDWPGG